MASISFLAITFHAQCSRADIDPKQSLLIGIMTCMLSYFVVVLILFQDSDLLYLMLSSLGIFIALAIVAFDTQIIIRTKRFGITQDDHIVAALLMHIDPILAIVHILRIAFKC